MPAHNTIHTEHTHTGLQSFLLNLGLTVLSVLLFAASFPNLLIENGFPFFAWIAYVPILIILYRLNLAASVFWGALYGYAAYGLFNYWLSAFHPLAGLIVNSVYLVYNAALFFALKLAILFFPRRAYLVHLLIWLAYEYLRTLGFLGYSYGISGYSQWRMIPLIQIARIFGVWGVSALVVFPSAWLANLIWNISRKGAEAPRKEKRLRIPHLKNFAPSRLCAFAGIKKEEVFIFSMWVFAVTAALVYGFAVPSDYSEAPQVNIALIQHNTDPWRGGIEAYRSNYVTLKRLSDQALAAQPKPDLVVWSETAFVPRIFWHETYRDDQSSWLLVKELLEYLEQQDIPFIIGNDDARKDPGKNPDARESFRVDYNAAMLYEHGKNTALYRKLHLVPFTEHFPYEKQLPAIYRALVNADTHFWEKGNEAVVFSPAQQPQRPNLKFSTPICFEDSFGYLSRNFVKNGAELIVNISNDAWSQSLPAQNQHLGMAVFRAVENNRSMVRATASGQTCGIAPNGTIIAMAPPFTEAWLTVAIPVIKGNTVYTGWGDAPAAACTALAFFLLLFGGIKCIITKKQRIS